MRVTHGLVWAWGGGVTAAPAAPPAAVGRSTPLQCLPLPPFPRLPSGRTTRPQLPTAHTAQHADSLDSGTRCPSHPGFLPLPRLLRAAPPCCTHWKVEVPGSTVTTRACGCARQAHDGRRGGAFMQAHRRSLLARGQQLLAPHG